MTIVRSLREIRLREELNTLQGICDSLSEAKSSLFRKFQPETEMDLDDTNMLIVILIKKVAGAYKIAGELLDEEIAKREANDESARP